MLLLVMGGGITVLANQFNLVLIGRLLQGFGSGGCLVLSIAILFDQLKGNIAMKILNMLEFTTLIFMALAPFLGSFLQKNFGVRSSFIFIEILGLGGLTASLLFFQESHPHAKRIPFKLSYILSNIVFIISSFDFWQMALTIGFLFSGYIAFLSGASMLFVSVYNLDQSLLPFLQALSLLGWLIGNLTFGTRAPSTSRLSFALRTAFFRLTWRRTEVRRTSSCLSTARHAPPQVKNVVECNTNANSRQ